MQPWSGVCAHHPPRVTAHSQHVHICPLQPLLGQLPEPPLRGTHSPFTRTLVSQFCFWDHLEGLSLLTRIQSQVTRATFLDHRHHLLVHSQLRPERPPWAPSPMALPGVLTPLQPGPSLSCPLQGHQEHSLPGQAVCPGEASVVSGARNSRHPWGRPTQHSGQLLPPDLFTLDGPRLGSGAPLWVLVLISSPCGPRRGGGVAKLLCA